MPIKVQSSLYGVKGAASVKPSKSGTHLIIRMVESGETFKVLPDEYSVTDISKVVGVFRVALSGDNSTLRVISPVDDIVKAKFVGFSRTPDTGEILIRHVDERSGTSNGKKWKIPEHDEFYARFEIPEKGIITPVGLPLALEPYEYEGEYILAISRGFGSGKVTKFLEACGVDFDTDSVLWTDDVMEELEALLLEKDAVVKLSFQNGYFKDISPVTEYSILDIDDEEDDEDDEKPAPKKPVPQKSAPPKPAPKNPTPQKSAPQKPLQKRKASELIEELGYDVDEDDD